MSVMGQSATFRDVRIMSALAPLADIDLRLTHVCCGPSPDTPQVATG